MIENQGSGIGGLKSLFWAPCWRVKGAFWSPCWEPGGTVGVHFKGFGVVFAAIVAGSGALWGFRLRLRGASCDLVRPVCLFLLNRKGTLGAFVRVVAANESVVANKTAAALLALLEIDQRFLLGTFFELLWVPFA